jgi:hypothetical protein
MNGRRMTGSLSKFVLVPAGLRVGTGATGRGAGAGLIATFSQWKAGK